MTQIDDVVYAVRSNSSIIMTYTADKLRPFGKDINIEGMTKPRDIVACRNDRHLYVADCDCCIWKVSAYDHSSVNWLTIHPSEDGFLVTKLSLTSRRLLVTSRRPPTLRQYDTTNRELSCVVKLPQCVVELYHAVETRNDTFVVGHHGTSDSPLEHAVSELFRFRHVLQH